MLHRVYTESAHIRIRTFTHNLNCYPASSPFLVSALGADCFVPFFVSILDLQRAGVLPVARDRFRVLMEAHHAQSNFQYKHILSFSICWGHICVIINQIQNVTLECIDTLKH